MHTPKIIAGAIVAGTLALSACATGPGGSVEVDPAFDPTATSFTGWVRVSQGEFQLFREERQVREAFARPCVSGALPRNAQRASADISGSQVTFSGRAVPWPIDREVLRWEGSRIVNACRGAFVIQADTVRVLR